MIWKFHPNGSGEICALFSDDYELSQLSSPKFMLFMLGPFHVLCSGMVLRLSNVKLHAFIDI
jgi:hypothetical protein